jgi:tetrahydromethanopterin S-methyltransferase subunit B
VVSFVTNLAHGSVVGLIVFALIAYVHLQVKPNYH